MHFDKLLVLRVSCLHFCLCHPSTSGGSHALTACSEPPRLEVAKSNLIHVCTRLQIEEKLFDLRLHHCILTSKSLYIWRS